MNHFFEAITNTAGDSLVGYYARVINRQTQNTVTLSADENGTPIITVSGVADMAKTDKYGNLSLYVEPGTYHLDIYAPNTTTFLFRVSDVSMSSTKGETGDTGDQGPEGDIGPAGLAGRASIGQVLTEDQLAAIRAKIGSAIFGTTTYVLGVPTTVRPYIVIASIFNSHGVAQGAESSAAPGEIFVTAMRAAFPNVDFYHDNYSVPGSWIAQYANDQIDSAAPITGKLGIVPAQAAAMAPGGDGRRRTPDIVLLGDPTNDALTTIYSSLQPPAAFYSIADALVQRLQTEFGAIVIGYTAPMWHPSRSLANGRADMSEAFFITFPKTGFVAGDDDYQTLTYSVANQTIKTNVAGQFAPGNYDNGLLTFDSKSWFYVPEQFKYMRIVSADPTYSTITVDNGSGGPVITEDRTTLKGLYQAKFNATTQIIPAKNNPDFSRNVGTQPGVALSFEKRPYGPNGEMITVSTRLIELNQVFVGILAKNKALLCDAAGEQRRALTADSMFDTLYTNNDDVHMDTGGYHLSYDAPTKKIVDAMAYGLL
jgi:hypothetical protein